MAKTFCMKCGFENKHDILEKPIYCGRCHNGLQKLGPAPVTPPSFEAPAATKTIFKVQPITDEELGLDESNSCNLLDLLHPDIDDSLLKRDLPLEETLERLSEE